MYYARLAVLGIGIGVGIAVSAQAPAKTLARADTAAGRVLFRQHCSACHGVDAKGNGSLYDPESAEPSRRVHPADLTLLSARNAGKFPSERVRNSIFSKDSISAHGTPDMPAWGDVFYSLKSNPKRLEQHVRDLTAYIESIQEPKK
jgi:mono/diheme cytochrome c family protein